jgi:hypothetical protein
MAPKSIKSNTRETIHLESSAKPKKQSSFPQNGRFNKALALNPFGTDSPRLTIWTAPLNNQENLQFPVFLNQGGTVERITR